MSAFGQWTLDKDLIYFCYVIQRPIGGSLWFPVSQNDHSWFTTRPFLPFDPSFPSSGLSWTILNMWWTVVALAYFQQEENIRSNARPQVPVDLQNYPLPRALLMDGPLPDLKMERSESRYPKKNNDVAWTDLLAGWKSLRSLLWFLVYTARYLADRTRRPSKLYTRTHLVESERCSRCDWQHSRFV
jgi:hypothetical protein